MKAGRGERPGRVVVQTLQPEHYSLQAAATHDFASFAAAELAARRELGYPPFSRLIMLRFEGPDAAAVAALAADAARALRLRADGRFGVLGPAPAAIERLRQRHRHHILVRGAQGALLRQVVGEALPELRAAARPKDIRVIVDVDPQQML